MRFEVTPSRIGHAEVSVPGDKSISHRSLMLGSIAEGQTTVSGFLAGEDCLATLAAMRALGVDIERPGETDLVVNGVGLHGLSGAGGPLDMGNSGTAMRLMAGLLAGQGFDSELIGDHSLSGRPMGRIITPLTKMGAAIESDCDGTPPLQIAGGVSLHGIHYDLPMASAQVKSCVLLAGLYASGETSVTEPAVTRDHTERMLQSMGGTVTLTPGTVTLTGGQALRGCDIEVPGDLSSATFVMLAAILADDADLLITNVGINPTRTGVINIFRGMGADISLENERMSGAEPLADVRVRSSQLRGGAVDPTLVSLAIDEFPALFVAAGAASGTTEFTDIGELRVKESDRISAMATGLRNLGIQVDESPDGAVVHGGKFTGGAVESFDDHRVAMSLAVAGTVAEDTVVVQDVENVETSFPGFCEILGGIGATITRFEGN